MKISSEILHTFQQKGKVCLIGDWNGRTAESSDFVQNDGVIDDLFPSEYSVDDELLETKRISEDSLVTPDRFGKSLLDICKCSNMRILNGRFGEASSRFTCNTWNGSSVVDYVVVEKDLMAKINSFEVGEIIDESDHCVIQFSIQNDWKFSRPMKQNVKNQRRKALKFPNQWGYDFSEINTKDLYFLFQTDYVKGELAAIAERKADGKHEIDQMVRRFENILVHVSSVVGKRKEFSRKNKMEFTEGFKPNSWFDHECKSLKKEINKVLKQEGKSSRKYWTLKKEFKKIM